jgi:nanoRNase/pAp phosphatase (c-di-AMP/oligoRNAs hydrolase)
MSGRSPVSGSMSRYAILGCGSVGYAVAEELTGQGTDVLILDKDESRVGALRDQDLNARRADIRDAETAETVADHDVVLVLTSEVATNQAAIESIRERGGEQFIVARAGDPVSAEELSEAGADIVINPSEVIAESALGAVETRELEHRGERLTEAITDTEGTVGIVIHTNPSPDSIASGMALKTIAETLGVDADIIHFGDIGHRENRAFANLLEVDLVGLEGPAELAAYDAIALVDHSPGDPTVEHDVNIYIDHFEAKEPFEAGFEDVRTSVSATSTILTKYIQEFDITPTETLATALLYGIRDETLDFKRDTTPADLTAAAYLHPFADHDILEQVESPSMSPETLDVLAEAIQNREVRGSHLVSNAGFVRERDALGQAAQHLLDLEGITTTAVFGIADDTIHLAARSKDIRMNIGNVLEKAFDDSGQAAGHSTQASVEIPLGIFTSIETSKENRETLLALADEAVQGKLFEAMGVEAGNGS